MSSRRVFCNGLAGAAAAFLLAACVMGPNYKRPAVDMPSDWRVDEKGAENVANVAWWEAFGDQQLDAMIEEALKNNKDIVIAAARIAEFRAELQIRESAEYPQLGYQAHGGREQLTHNDEVPLPAAIAPIYYSHIVAADASYEVDLWGRVKRSTEAALADLFSEEENQRTVILTLVSEVASGYIQLLSLDKELEIANATLRDRAKALELAQDKYDGGAASALELAQVKALYEETAASIPEFQLHIAEQENALSILMGRNPGSIVRGGTLDSLALPQVPGGVPSDILVRRPDVRSAEQLIVAANARIGIARTEYFPTLSLTSDFGFSSSELINWLHGSSEFGTFFGAGLVGPIFTGNRISADIKRNEAITRAYTASYLKTIQTAFQDVDNALAAHHLYSERLDAVVKEVDAYQDYARLAEERYEGGYSSYIEVLYADRSLFSAQLNEVENQRNIYVSLVSIYKAMGGGWPIDADPIDKFHAGKGKKDSAVNTGADKAPADRTPADQAPAVQVSSDKSPSDTAPSAGAPVDADGHPVAADDKSEAKP
jgi:multidrug efflux system outer membrane protein